MLQQRRNLAAKSQRQIACIPRLASVFYQQRRKKAAGNRHNTTHEDSHKLSESLFGRENILWNLVANVTRLAFPISTVPYSTPTGWSSGTRLLAQARIASQSR
jgi:hypothetical protein